MCPITCAFLLSAPADRADCLHVCKYARTYVSSKTGKPRCVCVELVHEHEHEHEHEHSSAMRWPPARTPSPMYIRVYVSCIMSTLTVLNKVSRIFLFSFVFFDRR